MKVQLSVQAPASKFWLQYYHEYVQQYYTMSPASLNGSLYNHIGQIVIASIIGMIFW